MKPKIHLFFNGNECAFPSDNAWEKFEGLDTARLFLVAAKTWERAGWEVRRLSSDHAPDPIRFHPQGACRASFTWYPEVFWQFIPACQGVATASPETKWHWFACIDVLNLGSKGRFWAATHETNAESVRQEFISFQKEHFSLSLFAATARGLKNARTVIEDYDRGALTRLDRAYVSDETILRNYLPHRPCIDLRFPWDSEDCNLLHYARSTVARLYEKIPSSLST